MAIYGFRGLGWFGCGVVVAVASYMATSQGAAERARLDKLDVQIVEAKKDIRGLETEFNTRASMIQLGEWNGNVLKLGAPAPQQYLADETALASLDTAQPAVVAVAAVVPAGQREAAPEPAVVRTADAGKRSGATATAQRDGLGKARTQAVAMVDDRLMDDLRKRAQAEQLALR